MWPAGLVSDVFAGEAPTHIDLVAAMLCRLCLLRYEKELLRPDSWLTLLGKIDAPLNDDQAAAFAGAWLVSARQLRTPATAVGSGLL